MGNSLKCCVCGTVLPPCHSFDNLYQTTLHGQHVHVFNGNTTDQSVAICNTIAKIVFLSQSEMRNKETKQERGREEERRREKERGAEKRRGEKERAAETRRGEKERAAETRRGEKEKGSRG